MVKKIMTVFLLIANLTEISGIFVDINPEKMIRNESVIANASEFENSFISLEQTYHSLSIQTVYIYTRDSKDVFFFNDMQDEDIGII